jgi:riboflavin synthase
MFNGLIREIAKVKSFSNNKLTLKSNYIPNIGDSVAVNGVCLTATKIYIKPLMKC